MKPALLALAVSLSTSTAFAVSPPPENFEKVQKAVEAAGHKMEPVSAKFCRDDGEWCEGYADKWVQIQVYGRGIIDVMTTSQLPHSQYRDVCAAAYAGLSGSAKGFADDLISQAFQVAAAQGRFKQEVQGVEVDVKPSFDNILGCQFFRY